MGTARIQETSRLPGKSTVNIFHLYLYHIRVHLGTVLSINGHKLEVFLGFKETIKKTYRHSGSVAAKALRTIWIKKCHLKIQGIMRFDNDQSITSDAPFSGANQLDLLFIPIMTPITSVEDNEIISCPLVFVELAFHKTKVRQSHLP